MTSTIRRLRAEVAATPGRRGRVPVRREVVAALLDVAEAARLCCDEEGRLWKPDLRAALARLGGVE